jgi:hypothetical protein
VMGVPDGDTPSRWSEDAAAVARISDATTSTASSRAETADNPTLVPMRRRLVDRLRLDYPQLRERVEGYILAQEWRRISELTRQHLMAHAQDFDEADFWEKLWDLLTRDLLRSRFPANLVKQAEVNEHVTSFRKGLDAANQSTSRAQNPFQAPQRKELAADVLASVEAMFGAADLLMTSCKDDARKLLESLNNCVDEILADIGEVAAEATATSERFRDDARQIDADAHETASSSRMGRGSKPATTGESEESYRVGVGVDGADFVGHSMRPTRKET